MRPDVIDVQCTFGSGPKWHVIPAESTCAFEWALHGFAQSDRETELFIAVGLVPGTDVGQGSFVPLSTSCSCYKLFLRVVQ